MEPLIIFLAIALYLAIGFVIAAAFEERYMMGVECFGFIVFLWVLAVAVMLLVAVVANLYKFGTYIGKKWSDHGDE